MAFKTFDPSLFPVGSKVRLIQGGTTYLTPGCIYTIAAHFYGTHFKLKECDMYYYHADLFSSVPSTRRHILTKISGGKNG